MKRIVLLSLVAVAGSFCNPLDTSAQPASQTDVTTRAPDAFYNPPPNVPRKSGALLRSELLKDVTLPSGMRGWRILYTTTIDDKTAATAVATVFAPLHPPRGPRPVITWEHGTTGLLQKCMPSLTSEPTLGIPALDRVIKAGWVIVATDYSFAEKNGPHPYFIGEGEARSGLDSVRAARQMPELVLDTRTVVWGHSQGAHSALWTGIIGPRYAPDVKILGVAAIAPPADQANLLSMNVSLDKWLGPFIAMAYGRFYPDIKFEESVRPVALTAAREIANLCGFEDHKHVAELMEAFDGPTLATKTNAALAARLAQNTADHRISAPLLLAQGLADSVVLPAATDAYVNGRCAVGQRLEYWKFPGLDHNAILQPGTKLAEPLAEWTRARFANEPQANGCSEKSF
jgi:pimeloyl-ACP methyl ester carboxylesterase